MGSDAELFGDGELEVVGEEVSAITLDSSVVIFAGTHREHEFRIENEFTLENPNDSLRVVVRYDPYNRSNPVRENLTELSKVIRTRVLHARAYMSGVLELVFSDSTVITVNPLEKYEAWTYASPSGILPCTPGGFEA
ncbi:MAG: DUF6188 family protein [Acidimicrobiales bacterium]